MLSIEETRTQSSSAAEKATFLFSQIVQIELWPMVVDPITAITNRGHKVESTTNTMVFGHTLHYIAKYGMLFKNRFESRTYIFQAL